MKLVPSAELLESVVTPGRYVAVVSWGSPDGLALDRPCTYSISCGKIGLALRLVKAIAAGAVFADPKVKTDMNGKECNDWLAQSGRTLQQFGAGGTPAFYINGKFTQAGDAGAFKKVIDAEIKAVNDSGIPAGQYYDKVVIAKGQKAAVMISPFDD